MAVEEERDAAAEQEARTCAPSATQALPCRPRVCSTKALCSPTTSLRLPTPSTSSMQEAAAHAVSGITSALNGDPGKGLRRKLTCIV